MIKLEIADTKIGKTFHIETNTESLSGRKVGEKIKGDIIEDLNLKDFEFKITGASDNAGFAHVGSIESPNLKKVVLKKGLAMRTKKPEGLKLKKTVRGNTLSEVTAQVNLIILKGENIAKALGKEVKEEGKEEVKEEVKEEPKEAPKEDSN